MGIRINNNKNNTRLEIYLYIQHPLTHIQREL